MYTPYLRLPHPSVQRAQGFLIPRILVTSNLGVGLELPYFIPVNESNDILLTPYFSSETNTLQFRTRSALNNGNLTFEGAISKDQIKKDNLRAHLKIKAKLSFGKGVGLDVDSGIVTDNGYLGDYSYHTDSDYNTKIVLSKLLVQPHQYLDTGLTYKSEIENRQLLNEYASTSLDYKRLFKLDTLPGKFLFNTYINSAFNFDHEKVLSRPPSLAQFGLSYHYKEKVGLFELSNETFTKFNSFVNSESNNSINDEFNVQYGNSLILSLPFYSKSERKLSFLTPKALLSFNDHSGKISGDNFVGSDELNFGNLVSAKRIASASESELGYTLGFLVDYGKEWESGERLSVNVGALKFDDLSMPSNQSTGITVNEFSYLGQIGYYSKLNLKLSADALFSNTGSINLSNIKASLRKEIVNTSLSYEYIASEADLRINDDLQNLFFDSDFRIFKLAQLAVNGRYDIKKQDIAHYEYGLKTETVPWNLSFRRRFETSESENFYLALNYDDDCYRITSSYEKRKQNLGSSKPLETFWVRVRLKSLADLIFWTMKIRHLS